MEIPINLHGGLQLPSIKDLVGYIESYAVFADRTKYLGVLYEQSWKSLEALGEDHEPKYQPEILRLLTRTKLYHFLKGAHFCYERHFNVRGVVYTNLSMERRMSDRNLPYPKELCSLGEIRFPLQLIEFDDVNPSFTPGVLTTYLIYSRLKKEDSSSNASSKYKGDVIMCSCSAGVVIFPTLSKSE